MNNRTNCHIENTIQQSYLLQIKKITHNNISTTKNYISNQNEEVNYAVKSSGWRKDKG